MITSIIVMVALSYLLIVVEAERSTIVIAPIIAFLLSNILDKLITISNSLEKE